MAKRTKTTETPESTEGEFPPLPELDKCREWMTTAEVAEWLRVEARVIRRMRERGVIPYTKTVQEFRYPREVLRRWYWTTWIPLVQEGGVTITITGLTAQAVARQIEPVLPRKKRRRKTETDEG